MRHILPLIGKKPKNQNFLITLFSLNCCIVGNCSLIASSPVFLCGEVPSLIVEFFLQKSPQDGNYLSRD